MIGLSPSQPTTASERDQIVARLADLQAKQEAATGWGAAVGAREEEIRSLESRLLRIDAMTAGNQPSSSGSKSAFDICVMIVEEECYLDAPPAKGNDYERAIHEVGMAIRDRIRCAQQGAGGDAQPPRTPLDLSAGELNALATDAFREAAQASTKPAAWFTGNAEDGFDQVAKEFEGTKGTIPLYATDAQTAFNLGFRAAGGGCHLPPDAERLFQSWSAVTPSPGAGAWTAADQFWEYVGGLAGEFEAGQMRDMLAAKGLSITSTQRGTP